MSTVLGWFTPCDNAVDYPLGEYLIMLLRACIAKDGSSSARFRGSPD